MAVIREHLRSFAPVTAVSAGFLATLIGVTSSVAIVFTAARTAGATTGELGSWVLALGIGMGVTCIGLSLRYRAPVVTAWSTPGAALLVTGLHGVSMAEAVGAFLLSAVLIVVSGVTGWFERVMNRIPVPLASALLAGVLIQFGTGLFGEMQKNATITVPLFLAYLAGRRWFPRYAVVAALAVGIAATAWQGSWKLDHFQLALAHPEFVRPEFSWQVLVGVGLPLFVVTMASQNLPGVAVLRNAGYATPISPLLTWTGCVNAVLAPFGCFGLNLAAITAAICTGEEAHPDRTKRYLASVWAGVFYLGVGVFGGTVGWLLTAMPGALVMGIAGVGLLGTIGGALGSALSDADLREPAVVTLLATASGITLFGIGSTFWGLLAGVLTLLVVRKTGTGRRDRGTEAGGGRPGSGTPDRMPRYPPVRT
ncbi:MULTISPECIES: benzoate/H(+) symporter BenE family transporter [unclassified Streptomyces]|uniref:benzoate/H(+) symporter BenE family transporter n=1 Tax=unclassified Streptomyces TaxID=2593676 RepID=UPI0022572F4A|nr:benzoate/H(+) symporter BenE family transporter [Streptomyces sp. NBC_01500]MCX4549944.1 benzoate/H(+) symporter BenE family transporter [Streptomyces sp. NBC_01500]WSV55398.1 benzoate/H(+) symporter BenE family transporter [Streptomyces sp. NBC_01014]